MKKILCLLIILSFVVVGCASHTGRGAGIGAGAGTIASVIAGKKGSTAALLIMGGALLGGAIGMAMDEQARQASLQPQNRGKTVMVVEEEPDESQGTNCNKVTKRRWRDGKLLSETIEETCTGRLTTRTY
ncbi:MAG: hypothetical protein R3267_07550 [Paenisporosarcina sp.]|nr:hypothetical protein [Paenisporosarcina sp.]